MLSLLRLLSPMITMIYYQFKQRRSEVALHRCYKEWALCAIYTGKKLFQDIFFMEHLQKTSGKGYIDVSDLFIFNFG